MYSGKWIYPVDPDCPEVIRWQQMADDPMMADSGCWSEFNEDFENKHRTHCKRCQAYGAANVDVDY